MAQTPPKERKTQPQWPFWLFTALGLAGAVLWPVFDWVRFSGLNPQDWGDFLAGIFSPLAFLWLLYASLAQREELKSQREEIELQRAELAENNRTQTRQEQEMARQATALEAQTKRLEAQTDVAYKPIFVLRASTFTAEMKRLEIVNRGAHVLDVRGLNDTRLINYYPDVNTLGNNQQPKGDFLPYWQQGGLLVVDLVIMTPEHDRRFTVSVTRLDLVVLIYRLNYIPNENRLHIESIESHYPD